MISLAPVVVNLRFSRDRTAAHVDILRAWKIVEETLQRQAVRHEAFRELAMTVRRRWFRKGD